MVIQINAELGDTVETAAKAAVGVANALGINALFYWDRVPFEVKPGSDLGQLVSAIVTQTAAAHAAREGKA